MTARKAVDLCRAIRPHTAVPVHYEGWKHFQQPPAAARREFAQAPDVPVRWVPIGAPISLET